MQINCPHCHNGIEVIEESPLSDIACPSCGSQFSLVGETLAETLAHSAPELKTIGRFELVDEVGRGAYGSVWRGKDPQLDRIVAVKIPRKGQLTNKESEQFFREARAAAQLKHPNIVPVHEIGKDGDKIYIVSDFVQGVSLADRLSSGPMGMRESVELCLKVSRALEHAHQKGVIHRDLKPANIMLDAQGEPHVMDFGLAKREAGEITMTLDGQILGTPAYMSPEQAHGSAHSADGRTDVYSVGVILFRLLTGELPFRGNIRMLIHQVINDEAPSPLKLNSDIDKDLATITSKCLEKDPDKRYKTAAHLAADFECFLVGKPIVARPVGQLEHLTRWCKRNPLVASLYGGIVGALALGAIVSTVFAVQANIAKNETFDKNVQLQSSNQQLKKSLAETRETIDHYVDTVRNVDLLKESRFRPTLKKLLADALAYYNSYVAENDQDSDSMVQVADSLRQIAGISRRSGDIDDAIKAGKFEIELRERISLASATNKQSDERLAQAWKQLSNNLEFTDQHSDALEASRTSIELYEGLIKNDDRLELKLDHANAQIANARILGEDGKITDASVLHDQIDNNLTKLLSEHRDSEDLYSALRYNLCNHAICFMRLEKPTDGLDVFRRALEISEELVESFPESAKRRSHRFNLATDLYNYGHCLVDNNRKDAALAQYLESSEIFEQLLRDRPLNKLNQSYLADTYQKIGEVYQHQHELVKALELQYRAVALHEELIKSHPLEPDFQSRLANHLNQAAKILDETGQADVALKTFQKALDIIQPVIAKNPRGTTDQRRLAIILNNRAMTWVKSGKRHEALSDFVASAKVVQGVLLQEPEQPDFLKLGRHAIQDIEELCAQTPDIENCQNLFSEVVQIREQLKMNSGIENRIVNARMLALSIEYQSTVSYLQTTMMQAEKPSCDNLFNAACAMSMAAWSASQDEQLGDEARLKLQIEYNDHAIKFLQSAQDRNYFDDASGRDRVDNDAALGQLRSHDQFQNWLAELPE